jgi:hypothetical protein
MTHILGLLLLVLTTTALGQTKVAMVKLIRGTVDVVSAGKTAKLKVDDWVSAGSVVKTAEKSFVKLVFIDKSQMNIGPGSEMKIESFSGKDSGVIDLVKGKIRSQVTKDYLQMKEKDKSKLFIKTSNAVMGIRGTDFMISTNGTNTASVLFEGEVVFNKLPERGEVSTAKLEEIVDRGVRMFPGEFSVMEGNRAMPTVPSLLNVQQREQLEKNKEMDADRSPSNAAAEPAKSVVPEGLNGQVVSNSTDALKSEIAETAKAAPAEPARASAAAADAEGYVKGNLVKPANGSFVHIESGVVIPPGPGAVLDPNTNTYLPAPEAGRIAADGSYVPPKNVEITNDGKILVSVADPSTGGVVVKQIAPPPPIVSPTAVVIGAAGAALQPPAPTFAPKPLGDVTLPGAGTVDTRFTPTGGIVNINDPTRVSTGPTPVDIVVAPK